MRIAFASTAIFVAVVCTIGAATHWSSGQRWQAACDTVLAALLAVTAANLMVAP